MRKSICLIAGVVFAWGCATAVNPLTQPAQAATLSWRFAGLKAVRENKDLVTWHDVTALPEFAGFNSNLVQRISASLAKTLARGAGNEGEIANALKPISEDIITYPTVYELNEQNGAHTWALAIQIPADRHELWKASWANVAKNSKEQAQLGREGNWTTLGNTSTKSVLDKARQPSTDVLQMSGDGAFLKKFAPNLNPTHTELKVTTRGHGLRTEGKAQFAENLPFKLSPWQIPTNTIREPIVGFTAIQGVADRLSKLDMFKNHPAPNQMFLWSEGPNPFGAYAAAKVDNSRDFIKDMATGLTPEQMKHYLGRFEFDTNNYGLYLTGLPIAVPFLKPAHSNDVNFVYAGLVPLAKWPSNSIPADLTRELTSRTNLVYYDWELGFARLEKIKPLSQIFEIATSKPMVTFDDPANKWLTTAGKKFGNTITQVSQTNPRELSLVRSSDTGLSALEWFAFIQWAAPTTHATNRTVPILPKPQPKKP